ncbi:ArsR/SmtB family transcription factor [Mesorhizobium sp. L-8-3]|uniref:ArsR/SmtB family transcription factor n=1 Tax=Mesorhizobium sp. L-8-3 TaxID=2744522 RepID=UPI0019291101|nr:metalloregulator ArsR/SmtB family transcription factor [Mesorhizobium sp. L-8-3]BCH25855.1 transcriptional regulator [Mesorhizobium sp. L-8-3]
MEQAATSPQPEEPGADRLAVKLGALSHPARIEILRRLSASDGCCCKEVVESLDLAQSTVSQHLKVLVSAGLVRHAVDRQRSLYAVDREAVAVLSRAIAGLLDSCCSGQWNCGRSGTDGSPEEQ